MSKDASISDQVAHDSSQPIKHKWRGKLFPYEARLKRHMPSSEQSDQDIANFLLPLRDRIKPSPSTQSPNPRIDISSASRWPLATDLSTNNPLKAIDGPRKASRKEGLCVRFTSAAPEIIGEGGDEAEAPASEASRSRRVIKSRDHSQKSAEVQDSYLTGHFPVGNSQSLQEEYSPTPNSKVPKPNRLLQRQQTGLDDHSWEDNSNHDLISNGFDSNYGSSSSNSLAQQDRSPKGSLEIFDSPLKLLSLPEISGDITETFSNELLPYTTGYLHHNSGDTLIDQDSKPSDIFSSDIGISSVGPAPTVQSNPAFEKSQDTSYPNAVEPVLEDKNSGFLHKLPPSLEDDSLISNSKNLKPRWESKSSTEGSFVEDALDDFTSRLQHFNDFFRIGATVLSPITNISLAQWIRTSAYWFLRGRRLLETAIRSEKQNSGCFNEMDEPDYVEFRQAHLNLAKAWWIVDKIIPDHPELQSFGGKGLSSPKSTNAIIEETQLTEFISVPRAIINNMRTLAKCLKQSNALPPPFVLDGLDPSIFDPALLRSTRAASLIRENHRVLGLGKSGFSEILFLIPIEDTTQHFLYTSMFIELLLVFQTDKPEEVRCSCVLSVLRKRSQRGLKVVIASPDGNICIMIQSDNEDGPTWNDVRWKIKTNEIQLKLSDTISVIIQLTEKDFKSLWGIHDYAKKIQDQLHCSKNEVLAFEETLPSFEYFNNSGSRSFPQGLINKCSLRLYSRTRDSSSNAGRLKLYDCHRIMVVTPPSVKTLSSITFEIGKRAPILFDYVRGSGSAPGLFLKVSKPPSDESMVMTFTQSKNRDRLRTVIDGTWMSSNEVCLGVYHLENFIILPISTNESPVLPSENFWDRLNWRYLRVIGVSTASPPSRADRAREHFRIWIEGEKGSFVDRLYLGSIPSQPSQLSRLICIGPGDLQISLDVDLLKEIRILRQNQGSITGSFSNSRLSSEEVNMLCHSLEQYSVATIIQCFKFQTLEGKHSA